MHNSVPYVTETQGASSVASHLEGVGLRVGSQGRPGASHGHQGQAATKGAMDTWLCHACCGVRD